MKELKLIHNNDLNERYLKESFTPIDSLKSLLNETMIAMLNEASGGTDWSNSLRSIDKWSAALNNADNVKQQNALIEIFIQIACKNWGCTLQQLDPGKDVLIKLIRELGFKENENPYLKFMQTFFKGNGKGVVLTNNDWVMLNNIYADDEVSEADLKGTGKDRGNHIIFNPNLYKDGNLSSDKENIVRAYSYLSDPTNVNDLNLDAIKRIEKKPKNYDLLSNSLKKSSPQRVRNIIIYEDPENPAGNINKFYWIKLAINTGKDNIYSDNNIKGYPKKNSKGEVVGFYYDKNFKQLIQPQNNKIYTSVIDSTNYTWNKNTNVYDVTTKTTTSNGGGTKKGINQAFDILKSMSEEDRMKVIQALINSGLIKTK